MTLPPLTLRNKLLLFAALLVLVPGVVIGGIAGRSGRVSLQRVIGNQLAREAHHTANLIAGRVRAEHDTLRSFARQDVMRDIRVGDIDKRVAQSLATLRDGSPTRIDYLVVDRQGRVVAAAEPTSLGALPHWAAERPRASDAPPARLSVEPGAAGLVLSAPIPDPDTPQATLGDLIVLLDWTIISNVTAGVRAELAGQGIAADVLVVDAEGSVLEAARFADPTAAGSRRWSRIVSGVRATADSTVDDELGIVVGRAALAEDLPDWKLLVAEPLSLALAPARRLRNRIALTMVAALATALLIATLAARRVASPLSELTRAIRGLSQGDPSISRVPVRTRDEVGSLAEAFNLMASELDRVQRNLVEAEKFAFVGELASGIAHEVRTSLGVLRSSTQMLERSLPDSDAHTAELAQMIRAEVDRLAGVVDDLLTLDRPRPLHLQAALVSEPVLRAADFVEAQAGEKDIRMGCSRPDDERPVLCDPDAIYQIAVNLLVNAVQALGSGGGIEVEILGAQDGYGGFTVQDDGAGIPEALRDRIYQPFVTARDGGVGLGLTFVKRVVHEHNGRITLETPSGTGARFRVELPLAGEPT